MCGSLRPVSSTTFGWLLTACAYTLAVRIPNVLGSYFHTPEMSSSRPLVLVLLKIGGLELALESGEGSGGRQEEIPLNVHSCPLPGNSPYMIEMKYNTRNNQDTRKDWIGRVCCLCQTRVRGGPDLWQLDPKCTELVMLLGTASRRMSYKRE
ncbi:hypothetical protein C8R45DRAFT_941367 [Mycena sanguinolenta]|nr:hypothetical protein C8R45DRAFT_941367 [Mycena sanguinolenta]